MNAEKLKSFAPLAAYSAVIAVGGGVGAAMAKKSPATGAVVGAIGASLVTTLALATYADAWGRKLGGGEPVQPVGTSAPPRALLARFP